MRDFDRFNYYRCVVLGLDYAVRRDRSSTDVTFEDGVKYTEKEQKIMENREITKEIHQFKRVFDGEVVG
jgi:hypothetical protein